MGKKGLIIGKKNHFILIVLVSFLILSCTGFAFAADRSYSIPSINMDIFLQNDGSVHVKETIYYSFHGTYYGVYRDIPVQNGQKLENLKVSTPGVYSDYNITNNNQGMERVTVNLFSNPSKTVPISDKDVSVIIEYDFLNVIKFYNDMAELNYKLVGESWDVSIGQVNSNIHVISSDGVSFFFNPPSNVVNYSWQGNILQSTSKKIHIGQFLELRMIIPKNQFENNPPNVIYVNQDILPEFEALQKDYQEQLYFKGIEYLTLAVLMVLACFIPLIIYLSYGREPKIDYNAEYERDIPTDDPPAVVNAISGKILGKEVGEPDLDGFRATILDMIRRNYLILNERPAKNEGDIQHSLSLKINRLKFNSDEDPVELWNFEIDIINFFSYFEEEDGNIHLERVKKELEKGSLIPSNSENTSVQEFYTFHDVFKIWKADVVNHLDDKTMSKLINKKGDKYLKYFAGIGLVVSTLVFLISALDPLPEAKYSLISSLILMIVSISSFIMPQKIAGQWTTYGEEYDARWHKFAKYLQDYTLMKEYPPESVEIWDKYLVYASALGIADKVTESMELIIPQKERRGNVYPFFYFGGYSDISSGINSGINSGTGGFGGGGAGGGAAGGGGGGAF